MKRHGFLMTEALLTLGILALISAAAFPLITETAGIAAGLSRRIRVREDAAYAAEYVTEAVRFARDRSSSAEGTASDSYSFKRKSTNAGVQTYRFAVSGAILRFHVYEGGSQPVTGDTGTPVEYRVVHGERSAYFTTQPGGLLSVSFRMTHTSGESFSAETSVLPLYDFLKTGEYFE